MIFVKIMGNHENIQPSAPGHVKPKEFYTFWGSGRDGNGRKCTKSCFLCFPLNPSEFHKMMLF